MKSTVYVEYQGNQIPVKQMEENFKEMWKEKGGKIKDLRHVEFYIKPEEKACYYVITHTQESGKFDIC